MIRWLTCPMDGIVPGCRKFFQTTVQANVIYCPNCKKRGKRRYWTGDAWMHRPNRSVKVERPRASYR